MRLIRYTERPELWANSAEISDEVWPKYNLHGDVVNPHWGRLCDEFPAYQFVLHEDEVLADRSLTQWPRLLAAPAWPT